MQFIDACGVPYTPNKYLSFDDVSLVPKPSDIDSRNDPSIKLDTFLTPSIKIRTPILSANMDCVTGAEMVLALAQEGAFGILHRSYKTEDLYIEDIAKVAAKLGVVAFSIGADKSQLDFVTRVLEKAPSQKYVVCVDVAHGHLQKCITQVVNLTRKFGPAIEIMAGNVCTAMGAADLIKAGARSIKVGVGNGHACSTRIVTGHGVPQLTAIMQCRQAINATQTNTTLIADGGIRDSGDIVKALSAGADMVMIGRLFAGTYESPGNVYRRPMGSETHLRGPTEWVVKDTWQYENPSSPNASYSKQYRGQSSEQFMVDTGKSGVSPEGESWYIPYQGVVGPIVKKLLGGIRSGMSYSGVRNLKDLNTKAIFIEVGYHGYIEGTPHGKNNG